MTNRIFNFSAGPATLPVEVLEEARDAMLSLGNTGIGILEHSHRGKAFMEVRDQTEAVIRELGNIPSNYHVLFIQGGASLQFAMVPMNLLKQGETADYLITGSWAKLAAKEAKAFGTVHNACSSEGRNFCYIPKTSSFSSNPAYVHYTSNNTIFGTQFVAPPSVPAGVPLICDTSSDMFSRPIDVSQHALIYAGAQKNLGPAGVTLVIVRDDLVQRGPDNIPTMLRYKTYAENQSLYNTGPTFGMYLVGLVCKWIKKNGGLAGMAARNEAKAKVLYDFLDQSKLFKATADLGSRSLMNVTFVTGNAELDDKCIKEATKAGFDGLKGHRSVGGLRASIYNAFPPEGVTALVQFLSEFEAKNS